MTIFNIIIDEIKDFLQNYLHPMFVPIKFILSIYIIYCVLRIMGIFYNYIELKFKYFENLSNNGL